MTAQIEGRVGNRCQVQSAGREVRAGSNPNLRVPTTGEIGRERRGKTRSRREFSKTKCRGVEELLPSRRLGKRGQEQR